MNRPDYPFGFRVVGPVSETRRLTDAAAAFAAHAACDPRSDPSRECYLSAFRFDGDFRDYFAANGTTKGYAGRCWSPWVWFDIDRKGDIDAALSDARRLTATILERYRELDEESLLLFFSGEKGFHVGLPLAHNPGPSLGFHLTARRLAEGLAALVNVKLDMSIYERVRLFRAPNSRHAKTGLHKRSLTHEELLGLSATRIAELAREPEPFEVPLVTEPIAELKADWEEAITHIATEKHNRPSRSHSRMESAERLQRDTLTFIREGADEGERATRLFRAAANLRELGGPPGLIHALLTEAALDSGLPPTEAKRVIGCGIDHVNRQGSQPLEGGAA